MRNKLFICWFFLICSLCKLHAQGDAPTFGIVLTGQQLVDENSQYTYAVSITGTPPSPYSLSPVITNGVVIAQDLAPLTRNKFVTVKWNCQTDNGSVKIVENSTGTQKKLMVTISTFSNSHFCQAISPTPQLLFIGQTPAPLSISLCGDACFSSYNFSYQWQQQDNYATAPTFSDITGATSIGYQPPAQNTPASISYRRVTFFTVNGVPYTANSNEAIVNTYDHLTPGSITGGGLILTNTAPIISEIPALGGIGGTPNYVYTWEMSINGAAWQTIGGGQPYPGFIPTNANGDVMKIRRMVVCLTETAYSNELVFDVRSPLDPGQISPGNGSTLAFNTIVSIIATPAVGGLCYNYLYTWEASVENGPWLSIGTGMNFPAGVHLTGNTRYRRNVSCGAQILSTNIVSIQMIEVSPPNQENQNYVRTNILQVKHIGSLSQMYNLTTGDRFESTVYFDGLGRPIQQIEKEMSSDDGISWRDVVKHYEYDAAGRSKGDFIGYFTSQNIGKFKTNALADQQAFVRNYFGEPLTAPTSTVVEYDESPLKRVIKQSSPGQAWGGSGIGNTQIVEFNYDWEKVHIWTLDYNSGAIPVSNATSIYPTGRLIKTTSYDERGSSVITYTDVEGQVILKKVQEVAGSPLSVEHVGWLCTYFVYDDLGQLRFTIPPKAVAYLDLHTWSLTNAIVDELCYIESYDDNGRTIVKKQPGVAEKSFVYDKKDRLVLSQDGNQQLNGQWSFFLYDDLNREVASGLFDNPADRQAMQNYVNTMNSGLVDISPFVRTGVTTTIKVDNPVAGSSGTSTYCNGCNAATLVYNTITHFDSYSYAGVIPFNTSNTFAYNASAGNNIENTVLSTRFSGAVTGSKVRVIDGDTNPLNDQFTFSTVYYSSRGEILQTVTENPFTSTDLNYQTSQYDFSGRVVSTFEKHSYAQAATSVTITSKIEYDRIGRMIRLSKNYNNSFYKVLSELSYNDYGQVKTKRIAPGYTGSGGSEMEKQNFDYNILGSLTGINKAYVNTQNNYDQWNNYFGLALEYVNFGPRNGKLTTTTWKSQGDNSPRKFDYDYDKSDRLLNAFFAQRNRPSDGWSNAEVDFSVTMAYEDGNGNIKSMKQMGIVPGVNSGITVDDLQYTYRTVTGVPGLTGNMLTSVGDPFSQLSSSNGILGDFKDGVNAGDDYDYDKNGNLTKDLNKNIVDGTGAGIIYNFLNKPAKIKVPGKRIEYTYNALGEKLAEKIIPDGGGITVITSYLNGLVYEQQLPSGAPAGAIALKYLLHEEGRIKIIDPHALATPIDFEVNNGSFGLSWSGGKQGVFEYFLKDQLGSVRMVLTEEYQKERYTATMETNQQAIEAVLFGAVNSSGAPLPGQNEWHLTQTTNSPWPGNPGGVAQLTASSPNRKIGPNMILKVMAGDVLQAKVDYFYFNNNNAGPNSPVPTFLNSLANGLAAPQTGAIIHNSTTAINSSLQTNVPLGLFLNNQQNSGNPSAPRAYINVVFFDEQFKFVDKDVITPGVGSDYLRVSTANTPSMLMIEQKAPKNGWVFIYLSNESNESVYFDNLVINHEHSRMAEETHYYPFGLKMNGISSVAFNKLKNNYKYQGDFSQYSEVTGWNEFALRNYDPQIGRWTSADPMEMLYNPFTGMDNDPVNMVDPSGGKSDVWLYNSNTDQYEFFDDIVTPEDYLNSGLFYQGYLWDQNTTLGSGWNTKSMDGFIFKHKFAGRVQDYLPDGGIRPEYDLNSVIVMTKQTAAVMFLRQMGGLSDFISGAIDRLEDYMPWKWEYKINFEQLMDQALIQGIAFNEPEPEKNTPLHDRYVALRQALAYANPYDGPTDAYKAGRTTLDFALILAPYLRSGAAANSGVQSLGAGRTAVKQWLQGAGNLERGTLIQNIESAGFKRMSPTTSPVSVFERGGMRIRLDPPQSGTPFNHMHLEYGGNYYDSFLKPVNRKSPAAHIPIR